jgi:copper(I)-binding protein
MKAAVLLIVLAVFAAAAAQCGPVAPEAAAPDVQAGGPNVTVLEAWARPSPMSAGNGAVYMSLANQGDRDDALLAVESDVAEAVELHETTMGENEVMRMQPVARIDVPAGGSTSLEPGGKHVMLIGLKQELSPGQTITLTLNFERSGPLIVEAEVRADMMGAGGDDHQ